MTRCSSPCPADEPQHLDGRAERAAPHAAGERTDFEVEVKFESALSERYQEQGILVLHEEMDPEAPDDFIHFDFYSDGTDIYIWAVVFPNGGPLAVINKPVITNGTAPLYMRVTREGDT